MKRKFKIVLCVFPVIMLAAVAALGEASEYAINKLFDWVEK